MSSSTPSAILCDGVWKKLRRGRRPNSVRDLVPALGRALLGRGGSNGPRGEEFWALRDVSFEVKAGQVLGIIGPNGAGKSTILRLLTKILQPSRGQIEVRGRIGALIELAAGFHSELTGRENIYLQGAIMGMKRAEIARKFDEIVAFAEVAEFIDTPVKHYSSGMNARLGFAIAAHLDPDVLLVDEVLAAGDLAFQRKAVERLKTVVRRDIPVVIVSHQLDRITELCGQAVLLTRGTVVRSGPAADCVAAYITGEHLARQADGAPSPVQLAAVSTPALVSVRQGERVTIRVQGTVAEPAAKSLATIAIWLRTVPGEEVVSGTHSAACGVPLPESGPFDLDIALQMNVAPGLYRAQLLVWNLHEGTEWLRGPSVLVQVDRVRAGFGRTYLDPQMHLRAR